MPQAKHRPNPVLSKPHQVDEAVAVVVPPQVGAEQAIDSARRRAELDGAVFPYPHHLELVVVYAHELIPSIIVEIEALEALV